MTAIKTTEELFAKIKEVLVAEFALEADAVRPESLLMEDLGLDSIDAVDLIVKLKPYISGKLGPELFKQVRTIQDVVEVIFPLLEQ
ncbi:MAG: phosphopantetheine-binding protein [Treponema sp.]|jgi:acyl carrier protein|nr:phosphopantetheine-binding protein [Treponema sp.]